MPDTHCRLCGSGKRLLTLEHVPPQSIGNRGATEVEAVTLGARGRQVHRMPNGFALRVLCQRCNNNTGSTLGGGFGDFAKQVRESGKFESPGGGVFVSALDVYPARVIRQLLLSYLCAQPGDRGRQWDPLREFIKGREPGLPPTSPRVSLYFNTADTYKIVPVCSVGTIDGSGRRWVGSEIAAPNLGVLYSLDQDGASAAARLIGKVPQDISHWADYRFEERTSFVLRLPRLRAEDPHPLGYGRVRDFDRWQTRNHIVWAVAEAADPESMTATAVLWRVARRRS